MGSRRNIYLLGATVVLILTGVQGFPSERNQIQEQNPQARQEDEDDTPQTTTPLVPFGPLVAQIITGAFTGNLDSIIKGSFGFVQQPMVNQLAHNTWETIKGNPTETPFWVSTTPGIPTEAPAAASVQQPTASAPVAEQHYQSAGSVVIPPQNAAAVANAARPSAPLQLIDGLGANALEAEDGTKSSPSAPSATASSVVVAKPTTEGDDEDESGENEKETTSSSNVDTETQASTAAVETYSENESTTGASEPDAETTTEDDDQDALENLYES